ncbi:hypothetical protein BP5796_03547 [Coleophoma crateriformis]|uniref:Zn(2)-C6 fungal-type domain-containing protein n=1 Tax=Coleophoma crateriformis TaxID=565419 RepID=A0A3D8SNE9_9HELO|nr:hypothetical protein BP5796_03547 [Coleophoma crateriformis]
MSGSSAAKRQRLSLACNECRRRKVKCDTGYPQCQNCRARDDICITTDPRRPGVEVTREWMELPHQPSVAGGKERQSAEIYSGNASHNSTVEATTKSIAVASPGDMEPPKTPIGVSPVQQPYNMAFNTDFETDRIKMLGGSSSQCLMKSLDVYLMAARIPAVSSGSRYGMQHAEEMTIPLGLSMPPVPGPCQLEIYFAAFFNRIHPLYPLLDIDQFKDAVRKLASMSSFADMPRDQIPLLASAYLVISLGIDESMKDFTGEATKYLGAAASLLGHVLSVPYLPVVQTLLLFTIAYRGRNKDGMGWQTLGIAVRIAHTLGLHRHSAAHPSSEHGVKQRGKQLFHARIWAVCCSLEKLMQLESGRPSSIGNVDCDQMMSQAQQYKGTDFLLWHMSLAQYQGLISQHIYGHQSGDRTSRELLLDTARFDRALLSWAAEIPEEFRPGNGLFCADHEVHISAFLATHFHQTMIALHRAALISPVMSYKAEIDLYCADDPSKVRLQSGEAICVSSARSIANIAIELSDRDIESRILTAGPLLLACVVLGISLVKYPTKRKRLQATDFELLKACVDYTANQFSRSGQHANFVEGIKTIYSQVKLYVDSKAQLPTVAASSHSTSDPVATGHHQTLPHDNLDTSQRLYNNRISLQRNRDSRTSGSGLPTATNNGVLYQPVYGVGDADFEHQESIFETSMSTQSLIGSNTVGDGETIYSGPLPFENLNVEEVWNWMLLAGTGNTPTTFG